MEWQNLWGGGKKFQKKVGCIEIGDNVFIGSGTRILYDVKVGSNVIIGAGSVVNKDVPDNSVVAGIPARVIGAYEALVRKHIDKTDYPSNIAPGHEVACEELAQYL